jgi:hypothetical protein
VYFDEVLGGHKRFEVRKNDRNYQVGDEYCLREWVPPIARCMTGILGQDRSHYTGRRMHVVITYVLNDVPGIEHGYCVWGFRPLQMP